MKIKRLNFSKLRNDAHYQFHREVEMLILKYNANNLNVATLFETYQEYLNIAKQKRQETSTKSLTLELKKTDQQRDKNLRGIYMLICAYTKHYKPELEASALRLKQRFDAYKDIATTNYNEETAIISSTINDLLSRYIADLKVCNILDWVKELEQQNNTFYDLMMQRNRIESTRNPINMRMLRRQINTIYLKMIERMEASVLLNGEAKFHDFILALNGRVAYYKTHNMPKGISN